MVVNHQGRTIHLVEMFQSLLFPFFHQTQKSVKYFCTIRQYLAVVMATERKRRTFITSSLDLKMKFALNWMAVLESKLSIKSLVISKLSIIISAHFLVIIKFCRSLNVAISWKNADGISQLAVNILIDSNYYLCSIRNLYEILYRLSFPKPFRTPG